MGKFEVGDRVRAAVDSAYSVRKGDIYTVTEILDEQTIRFQKSDGTIDGWCSKNFELVDQPWQPKVGDRVRFKEKYGHHNAGDEVTVTGVDEVDSFGNCIVYTDTSHSVYLRRLEPLPVAAEAQPAAMTIEAGKFYRTRDGRKVGPMRVYGGGGLDRSFVFGKVAAFTAPDLEDERVGGSYTSDGTWLTSSGHSPYDIAAEWVDEPAVAVAATASNDNAPSRFKVGDRVNYTLSRDAWQGLVIKEVTTNGAGRTVYWADDSECGKGAFYDHQLELITEPTAIVALIEDGQPKPSSRPHVHADVTAAIKEAERLAGVHRGQRFGVYVLHDTRETDQPDYGHEWKNLAARGQRIAAIKELRSLTGLNLVAAKAAVEKWAEYELAA